MFSTISGIIVMAVVTSLMSTVSRQFGEKFRFRMTESFACGIFCGLLVAIAPKIPPVIALVFMVADLMLMVMIILWWNVNGSTVKELILVSIIDFFLMLAGSSAAARIMDLTSIKWVVGLIRALPLVLFVLSVGFFIMNMIYFKEWLESEEFDPDYYLNGDEEMDDFDGESFYKKIWRWVRDEENYTNNYLGDTSDNRVGC